MLTVHHVLAFGVLGACVVAGGLAIVAYRWAGSRGRLVSHAIALAQTLIVAEAVFGLLLLADDRHAEDGAHYMYGSLAILAVAWPFFYAPLDPRRRLLWFGGATLFAAVLAVRAYMTA